MHLQVHNSAVCYAGYSALDVRPPPMSFVLITRSPIPQLPDYPITQSAPIRAHLRKSVANSFPSYQLPATSYQLLPDPLDINR